jgi:hypothetical protein
LAGIRLASSRLNGNPEKKQCARGGEMATLQSRQELIREEGKLKYQIERRHGQTVEELFRERE